MVELIIQDLTRSCAKSGETVTLGRIEKYWEQHPEIGAEEVGDAWRRPRMIRSLGAVDRRHTCLCGDLQTCQGEAERDHYRDRSGVVDVDHAGYEDRGDGGQ